MIVLLMCSQRDPRVHRFNPSQVKNQEVVIRISKLNDWFLGKQECENLKLKRRVLFFCGASHLSLQSRWWEWPMYPKLHAYLRIVNLFFWRREWQPILVFLPREFHEQRNLVGYCPWGHKRVGHDWGLTLICSYTWCRQPFYSYLYDRFYNGC